MKLSELVKGQPVECSLQFQGVHIETSVRMVRVAKDRTLGIPASAIVPRQDRLMGRGHRIAL